MCWSSHLARSLAVRLGRFAQGVVGVDDLHVGPEGGGIVLIAERRLVIELDRLVVIAQVSSQSAR